MFVLEHNLRMGSQTFFVSTALRGLSGRSEQKQWKCSNICEHLQIKSHLLSWCTTGCQVLFFFLHIFGHKAAHQRRTTVSANYQCKPTRHFNPTVHNKHTKMWCRNDQICSDLGLIRKTLVTSIRFWSEPLIPAWGVSCRLKECDNVFSFFPH